MWQNNFHMVCEVCWCVFKNNCDNSDVWKIFDIPLLVSVYFLGFFFVSFGLIYVYINLYNMCCDRAELWSNHLPNAVTMTTIRIDTCCRTCVLLDPVINELGKIFNWSMLIKYGSFKKKCFTYINQWRTQDVMYWGPLSKIKLDHCVSQYTRLGDLNCRGRP